MEVVLCTTGAQEKLDLSYEAVMLYAKYKGFTLYAYTQPPGPYDPYRPHPEITYTTDEIDENGLVKDDTIFDISTIEPSDPTLIRVVKELGERANGRSTKLRISQI